MKETAASSSSQAHRMDQLYRLQAPLYDWTRWAILAGRQRALSLCDPRSGERILDLGSGTGRCLPKIAAKIGPSGELIGLDCSESMLRHAKTRCRNMPRVSLVLGDICDLAGSFDPFDKILLSYSLTLIPDWEPVLDACASLLRPGGKIVVVDFLDCRVPGIKHLFRAHRIEFGPQRRRGLQQRFEVASDTRHRAYLGAWQWYLFSGSISASAKYK